jgi:hypothetical protein
MGLIRLTEEAKGELGNKFAEMIANGSTLTDAAEQLGHKKTTLRDWHQRYGHLAAEPAGQLARRFLSATRMIVDDDGTERRVPVKAGEMPARLREAADMFESLLRALGIVVE